MRKENSLLGVLEEGKNVAVKYQKSFPSVCRTGGIGDEGTLYNNGQRPAGMTALFKNNTKAFTLIELLVVVLIIGILAAVAVPQFQFAVDKTRAMTHFQNVQAIIKAEQMYKMANGNYTSDFTALDVDWTKTCKYVTGNCNNELANCPGNFGFQMPNSSCLPTGIWLRWCKQNACMSSYEDYHSLMRFSLTSGRIVGCRSRTNRGQKLCNYFTQQFGTSAQ